MFRRVKELVSIGNGSCNDFEGNKFSRNTQSDQRCYTTFYVELPKYHEYEIMKKNKTWIENNKIDPEDNVLDIAQLEHINRIKRAQSEDGTVSKNYFISHQEDVEKFYKGITMKLDYGNDLFLST